MVGGHSTSQEDVYDFVLTAKKLASYNRERNRKTDMVSAASCVSVFVCMCVSVSMFMCACVYVCMCVCVCVYVCMYV